MPGVRAVPPGGLPSSGAAEAMILTTEGDGSVEREVMVIVYHAQSAFKTYKNKDRIRSKWVGNV